MQENFDEVLATDFCPVLLRLVQSLGAFAGVGSINIEEKDVATGIANAAHDLFNLRHIRAAIEMHTQDVEPGACQLHAGGGAETARGTNNQAPRSGAYVFRHNESL